MAVILRLSAPLKYQYAKEHNLSYEKLLDASSYKENYREDMILWGESVRKRDPGYFGRHAIQQQSKAGQWPVWVVSDARRTTDVSFFLENYGGCVRTVRIFAGEDVRKNRGWTFVAGVDDAESECGLDSFDKWDFIITNDGRHNDDLQNFLHKIHQFLLEKI